MRKILIFLTMALLFSSCGKAAIMKPDSDQNIDQEGYGVLIFSATFAKNGIQELPIYFSLKGEAGGSQEIRLNMEDDIVFVFVVKEGFYTLGKINAENNSPTITRAGSTNETREIYTEKSYGFPVKAGQMTYAGNLFFKDFSDDQAKYNTLFLVQLENYKLTADLSVRQRMADLSQAMELYPFLKSIQMPVKVDLMKELDPENSVAADYIQRKKAASSMEGYGTFRWGMSPGDVKSLLEMEKKTVLVVAQDHLVDHTSSQNPVQFFFAPKDGENILSKVDVALPGDAYDRTFAALRQKYGEFARKEENAVIWITSFSKISLKKEEEKLSLIYEAMALEDKKIEREDFVK